jgi:hypothetical protein
MSVALRVSDAYAIENYNDLKSTVERWLDRDDLTDKIPHFIFLAEASFNRILRAPEMETVTTVATTGQTFVLPTDFLEPRFLYRNGDCPGPLTARSATDLMGMTGCTDWPPRFFAIIGRQVYLFPYAAASLQLHYIQRIPTLTENVPNNWLLDAHPDVYLLGALVQAEAYIDNPEQVGQWKAGLDEALVQLMEQSVRKRWGSGPLAPEGVVQVAGGRV